MEFTARVLLPIWFHVYQLQYIFMFTLQGTWSGPCCWASRIQLRLVGFIYNRQRLLRFARTIDYMSLTTMTTRQIRLRLVGFINNRWRLLDFMKIARWHASDYFDNSFRLQDSRNRLCSATTLTTHLAYKTSRNQLRLVSFIASSRFSGNLTNT
jgi:hypothetical protein